jgi:hypothetical protein
MGRTAPHSPALKLCLALNSASLFGAAVLMILVARSVGFSGLRLFLLGATIIFGLALAAAAILLHSQPARERRLAWGISGQSQRLGIALAVVFLSFWCITWMPPQYAGDAYYYFIGLYPLILCGLLASGSALALIIIPGGASSTQWLTRYFRDHRQAIRVALLAFAIFASIALLTVQYGILRGNEPFWYGAGVPILAIQILMATVLAVLASGLVRWAGTKRISADVILFAFIWTIAAIVWAARPVPPSYWITPPRPPNYEFYPFSDSLTYDVASQFALIGQGLYNHMFFDRALYMSFLVYLHTVGGQDFQHLMSIQAALFAVFPALLYLFGKQLHSRTAGLILAALAIMRGLTSLDASAWIDTSTFKHMLTDFPAAIGVAGFLFLVLKWMGAPRERVSHLMWACAVLGLTSLLRPHVIILMGGTALLVVWLYRRQWKKSLGAVTLASLAFLVAVIPWMMLGPSSGSPITMYSERIRAVIAQRYPRPMPTPAPLPQETPVASLPGTPPASAPTPAVPPPQQPPAPADLGLPFVADHFLHNLVASALIFPDTTEFLSVRSIVKEGEDFWRPRWSGTMTPLAALLLILNLAWVAFGLGTAVQRDRLRGIVPIAALLLYAVANSLARTSGGRYIVPVDWILVGYFSVATAELIHAFRSFLGYDAAVEPASVSKRSKTGRPAALKQGRLVVVPPGHLWSNASHPLVILLLALLLGALVPMAGVLYPRRYTDAGSAALISRLQENGLQAYGSADQLNAFMQYPDAAVLQGRVLYPLYYRRNQGEPTRYAPYAPRDYPRTVFMLIGPHGMSHVILPGDTPAHLPNVSDAIVLGCWDRTDNLISALAVVLPARHSVFVRDPSTQASCPLPAPVCDNNGNCY